MQRREFLKTTALAGMPAVAAPAPAKKMVGIQVGAVSFVDEGVERVLDVFQERGRVNTLFLATFTYGRGIAGRQVPGQPLPDHGKQEYDLDFHGGNFAEVHPQYYRSTVLRDTRAPDHGKLDILATVLPAAKKRGMKVICWAEDSWRADVPGVEQAQEKDLYGRNRVQLCLNNPNYRNFLLGLVEDYARSYPVDGIMWGSERQGALGLSLGAWDSGIASDPGKIGCFCEHCERKARQRGIGIDRAREGFKVLESYVRAGREGKRPLDGYYVTFWRIILRYPEILAWEHLWHDSLRETYSAMHRHARQANPQVQMGWHIWHNNTFNPIYRAEQDLRVLSEYSDFLKVVMYHNCAGERMSRFLGSVGQNIFGDVPKDELIEFEYRVMDFRERGIEQIPYTGFSSDYVSREAKRALQALAGTSTLVWPGIDIDIPTPDGMSKSTPEGTRQAVLAAFKAGAHGVLLSRKYSEMRLANLAAAGQAIRELGVQV